MPEAKNNFLKSKMNKDLDDRLIPNGEYRDAQNISVGKSEDDDVGALENIIGNSNVTTTLPYGSTFEIIGYYSDSVNDRIITFVTNYTDPYTNGQPTYLSDANTAAGSAVNGAMICVFDQNTQSYSTIVSGEFLNFSTTDKVLGVNLIEELLFFTDNRNQPRKINITEAIANPSHYNSESSISVAKYNPYQAISMVKEITAKVSTGTTSGSSIIFNSDPSDIGVEVGMTIIGKKIADGTAITGLEGGDYVTVTGITGNTVNTNASSFTTVAGDIIKFFKSTMTNQEDNATWPGDPDLIEDKYVRFSYRIQFEDGEYSIMAPFSQIAFIPKQNGYFISGNEEAAYRSTVVDFMENEINDIELFIPLPSKGSLLASEYKVKSIDLLSKESDSLAVKVLETIPVSEIQSKSANSNIYNYNYQSRKPYKTLPEKEIARVYDKVPVRAKAQETAGNRIIYGNFYDRYTPPVSIDYNVGVFDKDTLNDSSFVEYPNHTVKQNRTYQVGFVLADKFGRQSPVILSPVELLGVGTGTAFKGGSTIFHAYNTGGNQGDILKWFGDQMQVIVNSQVSSAYTPLTNGEPGLYAQQQKAATTGNGFAIATGTVGAYQGAADTVFEFTLDSNKPANANIPRVGDYLRGKYRDYVKVSQVSLTSGTYSVVCNGEISDIYIANPLNTPDLKFAYIINQTGWYSYKVVVKQTEQDYYNCYLPGMLNGYPAPTTPNTFPTGEDNKTAHIVLLNDNINKIPRDLSEVGPDQKQYRSSVKLYGRVENIMKASAPYDEYNTQYYPGRNIHTATTISTASDLKMGVSDIDSDDNFYQLESNPLIARISTNSAIGATKGNGGSGGQSPYMSPVLSVYETDPDVSLLDIFWETTTTGLISDLNEDVLTGFTGPVDITAPNPIYNENQNPGGSGTVTGEADSPYVTDNIFPLSIEGVELQNTGLLSSAYIANNNLIPYTLTATQQSFLVDSDFILEQDTADPTSQTYGTYRIKLHPDTRTHSTCCGPPAIFFTLNVLDDNGSMSEGFTFSVSVNNNEPYLYDSLNTPKATTLDLITVNAPFSTGSTPTINLGRPDNQNSLQISNGMFADADVVTAGSLRDGAGLYFTGVPPKPNTYNADVPYINHITTELGFNYVSNDSHPEKNGGYQVGYYTYKFKVKDAMLGTGTTGWVRIDDQGIDSGNKEESAEYTQEIRVVPSPLPSALITDCLSTVGSGGSYARQMTAVDGVSTYGWYVASATTGTYPSGHTFGQAGAQYSNAVHRLGSTGFTSSNTSGTMLLDLMQETNRTDGSSYAVYVRWEVWYRQSSSSTWSKSNVKDTNNVDINNWLNANYYNNGGPVPSQGYKTSINIPLALDKKGDYFVVCIISKANLSGGSTSGISSKVWVNVSDANYPSCIPEYGDNLISQNTGRDETYFQYQHSATGASCSTTSMPTTAYARTPYTHVVTQFFGNSTFTTAPSSTISGDIAYDYVPGSSSTNALKKKRLATFANMTQSTNTSFIAGTSSAGSYKNHKAYISTTKSGGTADRQDCSPSFGTGNDLMIYFYENYT